MDLYSIEVTYKCINLLIGRFHEKKFYILNVNKQTENIEKYQVIPMTQVIKLKT